MCAIHAKCVTIMPKEIQLTRHIQGEQSWFEVGDLWCMVTGCVGRGDEKAYLCSREGGIVHARRFGHGGNVPHFG